METATGLPELLFPMKCQVFETTLSTAAFWYEKIQYNYFLTKMGSLL